LIRTLSFGAAFLLPSIGLAQIASSGAEGQAVAPIQVSATTAPCPDSAGVLFRQGVDLFATGRSADAAVMFRTVLDVCPTHPEAAQMHRLASERAAVNGGAVAPGMSGATMMPPPPNAPSGASIPLPVLPPQGPEDPTASGRAELVAGQTLNGITAGALVCVAAQCPAAVGVGSAILGGVGVLVGTLLPTGDGYSAWRAQAINTGTLFGYWEGAMLATALGANSSFSGPAFGAVMLVGGVLGTGVGVAAGYGLRANPGLLAIANSSAMWTGAMSAWLAIAFTNGNVFSTPSGGTALAVTEMIAPLVGFGAMSLFGGGLRMSRSRALIIDLAATGGAGLGGLAGLMFASGSRQNTGTIIGLGLAIGTVTGVGLGWFLSAGFAPPPSVMPNLALAPIAPDGQPGLTIAGAF
jgi:hypothetical protein